MPNTDKVLTVSPKLELLPLPDLVLLEIAEPNNITNNIATTTLDSEQAAKVVDYLINHFDLPIKFTYSKGE